MTAAMATLCRLPSQKTSLVVLIDISFILSHIKYLCCFHLFFASILHVINNLHTGRLDCEGLPVTCADPAACQVGGSLVSLLHGYPGTFSKIFMPGHSQRDHPQLRRGQGQHHRGVDASKCHVRRGRLPGDLLTKYSSIVVVKAEEAYNVYL